jgi:hypothetical protein
MLYADNATRVSARLCNMDNNTVLGVESLSTLFSDALTFEDSIGNYAIHNNTAGYMVTDYINDLHTFYV